MKKKYIEFSGLVYKGHGWSEEKFNRFMDKVTEVAEEFGKDVQIAGSFERLTEIELDEKQKKQDKLMKSFAKVAKKLGK